MADTSYRPLDTGGKCLTPDRSLREVQVQGIDEEALELKECTTEAHLSPCSANRYNSMATTRSALQKITKRARASILSRRASLVSRHASTAEEAHAEDEGGRDPETLVPSAKLIVLATCMLLWLIAGYLVHMVEGYDAVTTWYSLFQIITTIGYGDVIPKSRATKFAISLLVLFSTLLVAGAISKLADVILDGHSELLVNQMIAAEDAIAAGDPHTFKQGASNFEQIRKLLINFSIFAFFIFLGTIFFAFWEPCSCSFGKSRINGCIPEQCASTGGTQKTVLDAFYMSVITLTTVGFGDETAVSWGGRLFSIFWMLFGVGSMINFVGDVTEFIYSDQKMKDAKSISDELFQAMDRDGSGTLNHLEYLTLQLTMQGVAKPEEIEAIMRQFDLLDRSGDGEVSLEEVRAYFG